MKKAIIIAAIAVLVIGIAAVAVIGISGKKSKENTEESTSVMETSSEPEPVSSEEPEPEPEPESSEESKEEPEIPEGYVYSQYTGLPVPEEVSKQQPVAIMINNHKEANPQSGLSKADIVYEIVVEGNITRYMAVFQDYSELEKIGPVRSARRYYLDFAMDQNAVLIHYGLDKSISYVFDQIGCRHIDGISGVEGIMCWRSSDRVAPHNVYTSGERLLNALEAVGFGTTLDKKNEDPMFKFYKNEDKAADLKKMDGAISAEHISIPYSYSINTEYTYDEKNGLYGRSIYGGEHIDAETGEQITAKNVLIQIANIYGRGDSAGHMDMQTISEGDGYYICNGTAIPVRWEKNSQDDTTKWYRTNGKRLKMVPGQTWISVVSLYQDFTIE